MCWLAVTSAHTAAQLDTSPRPHTPDAAETCRIFAIFKQEFKSAQLHQLLQRIEVVIARTNLNINEIALIFEVWAI